MKQLTDEQAKTLHEYIKLMVRFPTNHQMYGENMCHCPSCTNTRITLLWADVLLG